MRRRPLRGLPAALLVAGAALLARGAAASEMMPAADYDVFTETVMPHLEENLRYASTREKHCWRHQALASAFPILAHPSLADCRLTGESRNDLTVSYQLSCGGGHGTTGTATWVLGADSVRGTLNVRLGGKNMTFYQRVTATSVGPCAAGAE
jgi:hypothetical protein